MARPLAAHALLSLAGASPEAAAAGQRSSKAPLAAAAPTAVRLQCISARAAVAPQQHRGQRRSQRRLVCQQHAAAIRAAPPAALEMVASSEAVPSSKQSMRALSQRQRLRDVFQCQHEAALAACSLLLLLLWLVLARDANQPPGRSHGSPLATRATAPGAFFAFLACTQPRAAARAGMLSRTEACGCATVRQMARDANQPPGRSHGDSCDRSGGFFCVPSVHAATCAVHTSESLYCITS